MISSSHNFLFVHVPKTAGNSIQNVLRPYSDEDIVLREPYQDGLERFELCHPIYGFTKHSPLSEYQAKLPPPVFSRLRKIACVRNPWDRAISFYFSPHRQVREFHRDDFRTFIRTVPSMTHYLRGTEADGSSPAEIPANFDAIIRFERLQEDFDRACDVLDLPRVTLPKRNQSHRAESSAYYDEDTIKLVAEVFSEDIKLFDYEFRAGA